MVIISVRKCALVSLTLSLAFFCLESAAETVSKSVKKQSIPESPVRSIQRDHNEAPAARGRGLENRTIDGSGNNLVNPEYNMAQTQLKRRMGTEYADYVSQMGGEYRPGPREISNAVVSQIPNTANERGISDYLWQWGQFLDHDISLTGDTSPAEFAPIDIPAGDPDFDPAGTGTQQLDFNRSFYDLDSGTSPDDPRQQMNEITGWIDASNVYGSDEIRAKALRKNNGTGQLKTSPGRLLPFNRPGLPNAGGSSDQLFLAGDVRANEQVGLAALHTVFVREHNRLARKIQRRHPSLDGDELYERARRFVGAEMQIITYKEFIPLLLGEDALESYSGYDSTVDPRIMNEFSTAAYRFGHSLLNSTIMRADRKGREIDAGHLPLREAFFAPAELTEHGIEPILRGLSMQACQVLDTYIVDDVRNFLFGDPGHGGFDLAALNIQRGRDHGLPGYNESRALMGLPVAETFADITSDPEMQARLAAVYAGPDDVDLWVGGLAEDHMPGAIVGELYFYVIKEQFKVLRDGDRFWYQNSLTRSELRVLRNVTLSRIIRRNTGIGREMLGSAFIVN